MQFPKLDGEPVKQFSGVYRVNTLTNTISGNKFTQQLNLMRLRNQTDEGGLTNLTEKGTSENSYLGGSFLVDSESLVPIPPSLEELNLPSNTNQEEDQSGTGSNVPSSGSTLGIGGA